MELQDELKKTQHTKLSSVQVVSAVTGEQVEHVEKLIIKHKKFEELLFDLIEEMSKLSKTNNEFYTLIASAMTMMINSLPVKERIYILMKVVQMELSGKTDKADNEIKKFL